MNNARRAFSLNTPLAQGGIVLLLVLLVLLTRGKQKTGSDQQLVDDPSVNTSDPVQAHPVIVVNWVDQIERDPFELPMSAVSMHIQDEQLDTEHDREEIKAESLETPDPRDGLKLTSVMLGRVPIAVINGKTMQIGESIGAAQLIAIDPDGVLIAHDERVERLQLTHSFKRSRLAESESDE